MKSLRSLLTWVLPLIASLFEQATARHVFRHEAIEVLRRQDSSVSNSESVLTYVTPSPGASAITVTKQSQLVSSNVPEFTLCVLPPEAFLPVSATPTMTTAPYHNYSISIPPGPGTCTTIYKPTITMVCATTITGIDRLYPISRCNQDVTFSTEYGYVLSTPTTTTVVPESASNETALITPAPVVQTLTTYYVAPWMQITPGGPPGAVDKKICTTYDNGTEACVVEYYVWRTSLLTLPTSTVTSVNFTTTIAGPSQLIVETFVANVTEKMTTFSMSTTMILEWSKEVETTVQETRTSEAAISTGPTVEVTYTLSQVLPTTRITSTSTRKVTKTVFVEATLTTTVPTATPTFTELAAESTEAEGGTSAETSIDVAGILGIGQ